MSALILAAGCVFAAASAGGVIGHQIGSGRGNTGATMAGAIDGAAVGNQVEGKLRVGDRVRVVNNRVYRD